MFGLGAVGGSLSVIGWGVLNTCKFTVRDLASMRSQAIDLAIVQGNFRNTHAYVGTKPVLSKSH
jgi:hypothetical protein